MSRFSARFSKEEYEELVQLSKKKERSINDLIREAVRQYVEQSNKTSKPDKSGG
ncbi:ribbon-helix-helix protein, CopG family [Nostoc sp.]|uniref:ribbon-helix-helix protein, CopG family n=1 Tax=Nostoc sp. TaxID=1180 RepID=UPI003FA52EB4